MSLLVSLSEPALMFNWPSSNKSATISAFLRPVKSANSSARSSWRRHNFVEVYVQAPSSPAPALQQRKSRCTKATGAHRRQAPIIRVAALITAIGTKNTEPPGALAIPPKRHYLLLSSRYRATTPLQHDARSQHTTQARARAAIHF